MVDFYKKEVLEQGLSEVQREKLGEMFYKTCLCIGIDSGEQAVLFTFSNIHLDIFSSVIIDIFISDVFIGHIEMGFYEQHTVISFNILKDIFNYFYSNYYNQLVTSYIKMITIEFCDFSVLTHKLRFSLYSESDVYTHLAFYMNKESDIIENVVKTELLEGKSYIPESNLVMWKKEKIEPNNLFLYLLSTNKRDVFEEVFSDCLDYDPSTYQYGKIVNEDQRIILAQAILF